MYRWRDVLAKIISTIVVSNHPNEIAVNSIRSSLFDLYNLDISDSEVRDCLDTLAKSDLVSCRQGNTSFSATGKAVAETSGLIAASTKLQDDVKSEWIVQCRSKCPALDVELYWDALLDLLGSILKGHGTDALGFLGAETSDFKVRSFQDELQGAASRYALENEIELLKTQIADFFTDIDLFPKRKRFVAELSQGLFAWQALHVPPEVSEKLSQIAKPITILVDTSFLVDLIGLSDDDSVENANHVFDTVSKSNIDIKWRYLPATENELRRLIAGWKTSLNSNYSSISSSVTKALLRGEQIQGPKGAYLCKRSKTPISVDDFFLRYKNLSKVLQKKNIFVYQTVNPPDLYEREEVETEFKIFLEKYGDRAAKNGHGNKEQVERKENRYAIQHDAELLAQAAKVRSKTGSLLEAKLLILSADRKLAKFDLRIAKETGRFGVVLLPFTLLQMVRPFLSGDVFGDILVSNLLAPEFRGIVSNGGVAEIKSRVLSLLSAVEGLDEGEAYELLTDEIFVRHLEEAESLDEVRELIKIEAVKKNRVLETKLENFEKTIEARNEDLNDLADRFERAESNRIFAEGRMLELTRQIGTHSSAKEDAEIKSSAYESALERKDSELNARISKHERRFSLTVASFIGLLVLSALIAVHIFAPFSRGIHLMWFVLAYLIVLSGWLTFIFPRSKGRAFLLITVPFIWIIVEKLLNDVP